MALFRDTQIIKKLLNPDWSIEQEAQIFLFLTVEDKLRSLIQESIKFQYHFKRDKLSSFDIEEAMKEQNMSNNLVLGFNYMNSVTWTKKMDSYILNDMNCDLKDLMQQEIRSLQIPIVRPSVSCHFVLKEGRIVNSNETQHICTVNSLLCRVSQREIVLKEKREKEESQKQFAIIKDTVNEILSPLQQDQLKLFIKQFNVEILNSPRSLEFQNVIQSMSIYKEISGILPFLINFFYIQSERTGVFSYESKSIIVDSIESLIKNKHINLEFHLHILIKILMYFLTTQINSGSFLKDNLYYEKVAMLLNKVIEPYESKYYLFRENMNRVMMQLLQTYLESINKIMEQSQYFNLHICGALIEYFNDKLQYKSAEYLMQIFENLVEALSAKDQHSELQIKNNISQLQQLKEQKYVLKSLLLKLEMIMANSFKKKINPKYQMTNSENFLMFSAEIISMNELNIIL